MTHAFLRASCCTIDRIYTLMDRFASASWYTLHRSRGLPRPFDPSDCLDAY